MKPNQLKEVWLFKPTFTLSETVVKIVEKMTKSEIIIVESMPKKVIIESDQINNLIEIDVKESTLRSKGNELGKIALIGWKK